MSFSPLDSLTQQNIDVIPCPSDTEAKIKGLKRTILPDSQPEALIYPESVTELTEIVTQAAQSRISLLPCGNGSKLGWGKVRLSPQWVVSSQKLTKIIDHAVGDLVVTVQAGVKLTELQDFLQPYGQFLPIDPTYPEQATVGGVISTADTGFLRQRYGGVRDLILGLSFVRWDGKMAKAGGKVVKNVAGYDLMKLFTGSYGTLGIISEITFRLYPLVSASQTILVTGEYDNIAQLREKIVNSGLSPISAEILTPSVLQKLELGEEIGIILRFQSIPASIEQQIEQVRQYAANLSLNERILSDQTEATVWQQLKELILIPKQEGSITAKVGIIPSKSLDFCHELAKLTQSQGLGMINLGSGVGKIQLIDPVEREVIVKLRSLCQTDQGYLTLLDAPPTLKQNIDPWGYGGNGLEMMRKIKQQFDPYNLLNPNYFVV
ncbi:MAG: FAD-binding oxidoreductase [Microcystaceae cyanobacterium]